MSAASMPFPADRIDRVEAEAKLAESERRFDQLTKHISDVFWILDPVAQRHLYVSPAYRELWGLDPDALLKGRPRWPEYIHPEDRERVDAAFATMEAEAQFDIEYRMVLPDGRLRWVRDRGAAVRDDAGDLTHVIGIAEDVTERHRVHALMETQEHRLALALHAAGLHVWTFNPQRQHLEANALLCTLFGFDAARCHYLGPWRRRLHREDRLRIEAAFRATLFNGLPLNEDFRISLASGERRVFNVQAMRVGRGPDVRLHGVCADISERAEHQEALMDRNQRLKLALDAAKMSMWSLDLATQQLVVGPDFRRIIGLPDQMSTTALEWNQHILAEDRAGVEAAFVAAAKANRPFVFDYRVRLADGGLRWINSQATFVVDERGVPLRCNGVIVDVTERKLAELRLRRSEGQLRLLLDRELQARRQAEAAARARDQFLAIVSHELRSPLSAIQSWAQVLDSQVQQAPPMVQRAIAGIKTGVLQQVRLIDDLLDATRLLSGELSLQPTPVNLQAAVEAALASIQPAARLKQVSIKSRLKLGAAEVLGDQDRLQQIVWNLLSNAVKFTPAGGEVWVTGEARGDALCIEVRDNGKGIAQGFLPELFQWFKRAETSSHRSQDGLGLGLALVRHLSELHGGQTTAESKGLGLGACFTLTLPKCVSASTASSAMSAVADALAMPTLHGQRILLVDDQSETREAITLLLRHAGGEVYDFDSGVAARGWLANTDDWPQVLLCDIGMPDENGYLCLKRIRALEQSAPHAHQRPLKAIAFTAYAQREARVQALENGFDEHLAKPVSARVLIDTICKLL